jgi:LysM repeat protein
VAEKVLQGQGIGAWPVCGKKAGSGAVAKGSNTQGAAKKAPKTTTAPKKSVKAATPAPAAAPAAPVAGTASDNPSGDYVVAQGDTLSKLASKFNVEGGFAQLQKLNAQYIPNADFILVGQKIATK